MFFGVQLQQMIQPFIALLIIAQQKVMNGTIRNTNGTALTGGFCNG